MWRHANSGQAAGELDDAGELAFGLMFHGFDYPDETGENKLYARFWQQKMSQWRDSLRPAPRLHNPKVRARHECQAFWRWRKPALG
jgi:hypothetical protein